MGMFLMGVTWHWLPRPWMYLRALGGFSAEGSLLECSPVWCQRSQRKRSLGRAPVLLYLESSVNTALGSPRHKHLALSSHPFHLPECRSCAPTCCLGIFKREILLFGKIFICFFLFALLLLGIFALNLSFVYVISLR